jgi:hypothetical protein
MGISLLYALPEYREVFDAMDWSGEILDIEVFDHIDKPVEEKVIDLAKVVLSIDADIAGINTELDRLTKRKKTMANNVEQLRQWILFSMMACKDRVIENELVRVSLRNSVPRVVVENESLIPADYFVEEVTRKLNKEKVKEDLKNQKDVPGATLAQDLCLVIK